jgi:hypothetical protein
MSFGSNSIRCCTSITITGGYPAAVRHFEATKLPRGTKWGEDERPLYNTRSHHYRLVRGEDGAYYDVMLYRTTMLRMWKPNEDGTRELCLRAHPSSASSMFMWSVCGFGYAPRFTTTEGDEVLVPLSCWPQAGKRVGLTPRIPDGFSALITLNAEGRLIRERSAHYMPYVNVMSDEDKAVRVEWSAKLATYIDMLMLRSSYYHAAAAPRMYNGRPFRGTDYGRLGRDRFKHWDDIGDNEFGVMDSLAQMVYTQMLSSRMYDDNLNDKPAGIVEVKKFRANFTRVLFKLMGIDKQSGKRVLGNFPVKVPQKYRFD